MSSGHQEAGTVYDIVWILGSLACLGSPRNRVSVHIHRGIRVHSKSSHSFAIVSLH